MIKLMILLATFGAGFYYGVKHSDNPVVVNGPRIIGTAIKVASETTKAAQDLSEDGMKIVNDMGDDAIDAGKKAKDVVKMAPKVFK